MSHPMTVYDAFFPRSHHLTGALYQSGLVALLKIHPAEHEVGYVTRIMLHTEHDRHCMYDDTPRCGMCSCTHDVLHRIRAKCP